jgi:hypothetical protein
VRSLGRLSLVGGSRSPFAVRRSPFAVSPLRAELRPISIFGFANGQRQTARSGSAKSVAHNANGERRTANEIAQDEDVPDNSDNP